MKKLVLGLSMSGIMLLAGCSSVEDKYIGSYSVNGGQFLTLSKNGKCIIDKISCKWNAEDKQILVGDKEFILNIVNVDDDTLTTIVPSKGNSKNKIYKIGGTTWKSIVGEYKCLGFITQIDLKMDGSYESGLGNGNWGIKREGAIRLIPSNKKANKVTWEYKNEALYFSDEKICQKI